MFPSIQLWTELNGMRAGYRISLSTNQVTCYVLLRYAFFSQ